MNQHLFIPVSIRAKNFLRKLIKRDQLNRSEEENTEEYSCDKTSNFTEQVIGQTESATSLVQDLHIQTEPVEEVSLVNVDDILESVTQDIEEDMDKGTEVTDSTILDFEQPVVAE